MIKSGQITQLGRQFGHISFPPEEDLPWNWFKTFGSVIRNGKQHLVVTYVRKWHTPTNE